MALLSLENLELSFGGVAAVSDVSFQVNEGEILSLIGPNGAGKTTIFNCISRLYKPDRGRMTFNGRLISKLKAHRIAGLGIARTFQNIELFTNMTVIGNILLGRCVFRRSGLLAQAWFYGKARREEIEHRRKAEEIIDFLDLQAHRDKRIGSLPYGVQKLVELGRALALEPKLLLMDEVSSGMNLEETQDLMIWIRDIRDDLGVTLVLVEHDMRLVMAVSDRIVVIDHGQKITEGPPSEVQANPEVIRAYLGESDGLAES
ncbi:MAG: ABC transporter ATP-binding protein [Proteobacteria bacterium]|nr:ABC transporter ATP-binding protein [Pseudomonadota bacterium]MBU1740292.1 ABC transporter ATP-binding protein [Pseudomonadota bacterium]